MEGIEGNSGREGSSGHLHLRENGHRYKKKIYTK